MRGFYADAPPRREAASRNSPVLGPARTPAPTPSLPDRPRLAFTAGLGFAVTL